MKRFFFSVSDAADLVIRNLHNIHTTRWKNTIHEDESFKNFKPPEYMAESLWD